MTEQLVGSFIYVQCCMVYIIYFAIGLVFVNVEVYYLIHWEDEHKVSIHRTSDINLELEESGVAYVKIGRKHYAGKIAGYGMFV